MKKNILEKIALVRRVQLDLAGSSVVGLVQDSAGWHLRALPERVANLKHVSDEEWKSLVFEGTTEADTDPELLVDACLKTFYREVTSRISDFVRNPSTHRAVRRELEKLQRELEIAVVS